MNTNAQKKAKKVKGQIIDPFKDARANNVFNNIQISDDIAYAEEKSLTSLVHQSRLQSAHHRPDKEIKTSLRDLI